MNKYDSLARTIVQNVGGEGNIIALTHCVSRLRFRLRNESKANTEALNNTEGIVTVIRSGGQYMLVIGNHVTDVYNAVCAVGHLNAPRSMARPGRRSVFQKLCAWFTHKEPAPLSVPQADDLPADGKVRILYAPVTGHIRVLDQIEDPVFSSEVLGRGCAIEPTIGEVHAPADGVISQLAETKHAVSMVCDNGLEVLIHVGMETVELKGKGYEPYVKVGDHVQQGQLLFRFDMQAISAAGYALTTPVVVSNSDNFAQVETLASGKVKAGQELLWVR